MILDLTTSGVEVSSFDSGDSDCGDEGWSLNLGVVESSKSDESV